MKVISMYLPQFHRIKENDEWWGEGFTEWTAVKNAVPLFKDHYQPHIPLDDDYYCLLDKKTMQWQADLMKKYEIDGQCIYHYWFKNGQQILQKPAENLLKWTDIDMPFCFCWANESWARTWSRLRNRTSWSTKLEPEQMIGDDGILLEQQYGDEKDWEQHFDYLLPFFKDHRYIKIDDKPIFMVYKISEIMCWKKMMTFWRGLARNAGFSDMYFIGANNHGANIVDLTMLFEPEHALRMLKGEDKRSQNVYRCDYKDVWNEILSYSAEKGKLTVQGFVGRDNTPRHGRGGEVVENADPGSFKEYLSELIAKNVANDCDLTFINAWNEWGEGMHLEPDKKNGFGFLEAIPYAKKQYPTYLEKYRQKSLIENNLEIGYLKMVNRKYKGYWTILDAWLTLKEQGISLEDYFIKRDVKTIIIYGIGLLGKHLYYELENSKIEIRGVIDRRTDFNKSDVVLYRPEDEFPNVDLIVVTATYAYDEIAEQLEERGYKNVISLAELIGG